MKLKEQIILKVIAMLNRMTDFQLVVVYRFAQRLLHEQGN